ncbi:MAG: rod shape-determining protein MreC [Candidatus Pacebacteria bacterium]|nr:rod shape-determining protein MreC [Candidatus Paceibacterota bacterium]
MKTFNIKRIIFLLLATVAIIFVFSFFKDGIKNWTQNTFFGVKNFLWTISLNNEKSCSFKEASYDIKLAELDSLKEENKLLREIVGISLDDDYIFEIASITQKNVLEDVITVNKGTKDGIKENMVVLTSEKALVGKVVKTYPDYSEVLLISSKKSVIDVKIISEGDYAIISGSDNQKILLDNLEKKSLVKEGDICVTSALGGHYEEGLLVGKIKSIVNLASEVYKTGEVKPFFNLADLDKVLIIKNDK